VVTSDTLSMNNEETRMQAPKPHWDVRREGNIVYVRERKPLSADEARLLLVALRRFLDDDAVSVVCFDPLSCGGDVCTDAMIDAMRGTIPRYGKAFVVNPVAA
jgi:hypothetical protein